MTAFKSSTSATDFIDHALWNEKQHYVRRSVRSDGSELRFGMVVAQVQEGVTNPGDGDDNILVLEGRAQVTTSEGEVIDLQPGDMLSLPKGVSHEWRILEVFRAVFVWVS